MPRAFLAWGVSDAVSGAITYFFIDPYGWQGVVLGMPNAYSFLVCMYQPLSFYKRFSRFDYYSRNVKKAEKTIEQLHKLNERGKVSVKLKEVHAPNSGNNTGLRMTCEILERVDNLKTQFS